MSTETTASRWYLVTNKAGDGECLVEANNRAQAFRRAAEHYCEAHAAGVGDSIRVMQNGGEMIPFESGEQLGLPLREADEAPPPESAAQVPALQKAADVFNSLPEHNDE